MEEGIVVQTAVYYVQWGGASYVGAGQDTSLITSAPCRVIVTYIGESNA